MQRHLLEPVGSASVPDVVGALGAVLATNDLSAETAVGARSVSVRPGDLGRAFADGEVVKAFSFRGAVHYLSPEDGGAYLALRAAGRQWELPSWQEHYGLGAADWPAFRESVRAALEPGPLTVAELGEVVTREPAYRHLRPSFADGAGTLVKPLMWQGDICFAPRRDGRHTVQRLTDVPRWSGVWDLDEAGRHAIVSYLRSYGPATEDHIRYWLGEGLSAGRKRLTRWLGQLEDQLVTVDVGGGSAYVLGEDVDGLRAARPTGSVRLLPGHDQWVMGPGTKDVHVVPPAHRSAVTRGANLVVVDGVVSGTWSRKGEAVELGWFEAGGAPPRQALASEVDRLAVITGQPLRLSPRRG